jgi:Ca2+-binding EF-hand superfamily protein
MIKQFYALCAVAAMGVAAPAALAADNTLKMMDTNGDGLISKAEYMKHHERMWGVFKKNKDGLVTIEDMKRAPGSGAKKDDPPAKAGTATK